jgi:hypothetical protein
MKKSTLFISITVFLLCNLGCEDLNIEKNSFSIIGTWKLYWRSSASADFTTTNPVPTYQFNKDGSYIYDYNSGKYNGYYYFCESSNVFKFSVNTAASESCSCSSSDSYSMRLDGTDTFYWSLCTGDKSEFYKLVKL